MGAYLSEPLTNKESEDGTGNRLRHGASTVQGWRASQEDAHHCVSDFDEKSSLYGVYDGHGGAEVAIYVAKHFPNLFKSTEAYLEGDIEKAFIQAYLKMDASIKDPEVLAEIQRLAKGEGNETGETGVDHEEENVAKLYEEATMPLDKLVAKYHNAAVALALVDGEDSSEKPCSSKVCATSSSAGSSSSPSKKKENDDDEIASFRTNPDDDEIASFRTNTDDDEIASFRTNGDEDVASGSSTTSKDSPCKKETNGSSNNVEEKGSKSETSHCNGNGVESSCTTQVTIADAEKLENTSDLKTEETEGSPSKPRKGKVHPVPFVSTDETEKPPKRESRKATLAGLMAFGDDSDSSDFSSDSDHLTPKDDDADSDDEVGDDESSDGEGSYDSEDDEEDEDDSFLSDMQEPGFDSGTTAVVSFLRWDEGKLRLWVANAGDSRCIVSRKGEAIDMSYDHKPESDEETLRIIKAGGKVTEDGRVNGGLNLSRALGDHSYKQNATLPPEEQMISPMPTIQYLELTPETDEFIVLACDGVWNSMSSQQVVDFVKERIAVSTSLSNICEELFDSCMAEDTCGDGTGCDNMTAIIVQLPKPSELKKRAIENTETDDIENSEPAKRPKLEV